MPRRFVSLLGILIACSSAGSPGPASPSSAEGGTANNGSPPNDAGAPPARDAGAGHGAMASAGSGAQPGFAGQGSGGAAAGAAGAGTAGTRGGSAGMGAAGVGTAGAGAAGMGTAGSSSASVAGAGPAEGKAAGYGQAATGGGKSAPQQVATLAAMQAAIDAYSGSGGLVLEYGGKFSFASITDPCVQHTLAAQTLEIKNKSDVTILGADGSAANFGIHIAGSASNIIVRNMTIGLLPGGSDSDLISLEGMSSGFPKDVWIDHNELFTSMADCPGAGDTAFDGMIDIKKGADNVTVSYNYMHDHHKVSLNGYSDDDSATRHVTFHHNVIENVGSRVPLQRHGYSHVLNNIFSKVLTSGINVRMQGYALIEANYFENVLNPVTSRDSPTVGYWDLRDNNLASAADVAPGNAFGITWDAGNSGTVNATDWTTTAAFPVPLGYSYKPDPFACVHDGLRAVAGAGKALATLTCR